MSMRVEIYGCQGGKVLIMCSSNAVTHSGNLRTLGLTEGFNMARKDRERGEAAGGVEF